MAERRKLGRPSFSPTRKEAFRKDSNMSKKMFRDKKRQKRDEALSTVVPPTATRYKHIRVTTATFWRWRSLAQELGLDGDEQMASFLLNTYYERAVEAASQEQRQDIPPNSEESRQIVETSMFPDDEQGTETDAIGSTSTTLPMQATQDGSIGLLLTEPPPDSMKEQVEDDWRGGDGDKTNDGGEMVLEGKFTCLIKTEPHESGEESNEQEALPSVSQQGDSLAGDDRKEIEEVEFKCLIKEEPDDGEHNQPSCSQQGGNSSKQSSCQEIGNTQIISGDTSHDRSHGRHLPGDHPLQGTLSHSSPRGNCSSGNVGKHSSCQQKANTQIISGDSSHDRSHGKHLPGDYPLQGAPSHSSPRGNRSSWDSRKQSSYQREAQEISHDRSHERPPQDFPIPAVLGNHSDLSTRGNYSSGDSRGQRSHHKESALIISGDPSVDTSHDGPRGEHLPEDFPIQTILGNLAGLSARGSYSGGDSRGQRSHHKESALTMSGDPSGDTSHDRPRGEHLPEDFPIQTVLGNLAGLSARGSYSGEYDSHLLPNQGNYATDSATMSDDHEEERLNLKTDAIGLGEKCETASSKQKSSQISSTRTKQSNPCINSAGEQLFTCSVCQKGYNRKHNLYRHMRLHSGERPHECTYCKKRFWQSSELKRHLRIHTGQKPYSCSVCDKQFRFSSNLKKHMAVHLRKRRKYQCAFCDEGFSTRALRDAHSASAHPSGDSRGQSSHHKESALKMSGDPSGDTSHDGPRGEHLPEDFPIQTVLGNLAGLSTRGSFSSEYGAHLLPNQGDYSQWQSPTMSDDHKEGRLDLKTDNARELDEKSSNVSSTSTNQTNLCINQQLFTCSVCQKGYNRKHNLYRHMRLHSGERPHECTYCKKRFWQSSELKRHLRIHTGQKPYSCSVCDKQFRDTSNLKVHMAVHLRKKKKYQCSFCDEGFSTRALRDTHSASAHPSEKPFHCMECDMRFCRRGSLQVHIWRTHTARDKPHVCSFCNKAFSHLCFLTTHKRIHTGEKPYECTVCGDRFSFHTQLADHKAKHTGVKPYSCSICEKRFWRKSCLNRHQRTHTGKKPFQCPECKKGFAEKSTLIKHLNTHPNL
ncbi:zinc finger protein 761-like isoform X8 [Lytechinus variegatus]|uniref:zinc finger protein 761-like isoform X8 n=1 Tax=Lytechinus variegatus TaxID=7654 RepID=UPI001BB27819|nr:zinc finger protein 761-like isoform X8 [Lytechinus variegatus]